MTVLVALVLSGMSTMLKPTHELNEALYAKKAILAAVQNKIGKDPKKMEASEVIDIFNKNIKQEVFDMKGNLVDATTVEAAGHKGGMAENIDMKKEVKKPEADRLLPLYTYTDGSQKYYIMNVRGKGLWDEIWGNIAFEKDLKTIAGVDFDHTAETPGLGAEIKDNAAWKKQFIGKTIYNDAGEYTSVGVIKGGAKYPEYEVDGISGATITANGVGEMLHRGLQYYKPVIDDLKK